MGEVTVSPFPIEWNVNLINKIVTQSNPKDMTESVELVSKEVQSSGGLEMEYSMRDSGYLETQEPEEFECLEDSVVPAKKAAVVWVEESTSSTREYQGNLRRMAEKLPGYWVGPGLQEYQLWEELSRS